MHFLVCQLKDFLYTLINTPVISTLIIWYIKYPDSVYLLCLSTQKFYQNLLANYFTAVILIKPRRVKNSQICSHSARSSNLCLVNTYTMRALFPCVKFRMLAIWVNAVQGANKSTHSGPTLTNYQNIKLTRVLHSI